MPESNHIEEDGRRNENKDFCVFVCLFTLAYHENSLPTGINSRALMQEVIGRFLCVENDDMGAENVHVDQTRV